MMVLQTLFRFFCCSLKGIVTPGSKFQIFAKDFTIHSTKYIFLSFFVQKCNLTGILLGE